MAPVIIIDLHECSLTVSGVMQHHAECGKRDVFQSYRMSFEVKVERDKKARK